jgi:hypothetical protein
MSVVGKWLVLFLTVLAVYGSDKTKYTEAGQFAPGPASSYPAKQTNDKVTIGVEVYDNETKARTAFGKTNPYSMGILPVLVVIQNDTGKALSLSSMRVELMTADRKHIEATPAKDVRVTRGPRKPNVAGGSDTPKIPLPLPAKKNKLDTWEIEGRAFAARMLPVGESANGFFYFQTEHRAGSSLYITGIREAASGKETFYFEIPLQ